MSKDIEWLLGSMEFPREISGIGAAERNWFDYLPPLKHNQHGCFIVSPAIIFWVWYDSRIIGAVPDHLVVLYFAIEMCHKEVFDEPPMSLRKPEHDMGGRGY